MSQQLHHKVDRFLEFLLPSLINLIQNSAKVNLDIDLKGAVLLRTTGTIWGPQSEFLFNLHQTWHSMRFYTLTDDVKRIFVFVNLNFTPYFEYLWQFGTIFGQNTAK